MTDYDVCLGTGDVPTPMDNDTPCAGFTYTPEEIKTMEEKGYVRDTNGHWYDPTNYIDCLFADW